MENVKVFFIHFNFDLKNYINLEGNLFPRGLTLSTLLLDLTKKNSVIKGLRDFISNLILPKFYENANMIKTQMFHNMKFKIKNQGHFLQFYLMLNLTYFTWTSSVLVFLCFIFYFSFIDLTFQLM